MNPYQSTRAGAVMVTLVTSVMVVAIFLAGCDPKNDGVGNKGRVTSHSAKKTGNTWHYTLTIKDETTGKTTFSVNKPKYDQCSVGEYYPGCYVKW